MNQPTEDRIRRIEEEQRRLREEQEEIKRRLEQRTEEIPAFNVNVGSKDVLDRLDKLEHDLEIHAKTWLDTLQENYTEHRNAIDDVQTVQKGHIKFFEAHGKRLAVTATKDDLRTIEARLDTTATKEDISAMATKDDVAALKKAQDEQRVMLQELLNRLPPK